MATLASRLLGANLTFHHPDRDYSALTRVLALLPRRRGGDTHLLVIAAHPGSMLTLGELTWVQRRFKSLSVWIIDDFWADRIPRFVRFRRVFDHVFVTDAELVGNYADVMGAPCTWLPWGTDTQHPALQGQADRGVDVLRLGRQPVAWDDDETNRVALAQVGITYAGRFPVEREASENQSAVLTALARSKVALASAPSASRADYTHQTRDYISARWCDAQAAGTLVLGRVPRCDAANLLLDEGLLDVDVSSQAPGLAAVQAALDKWTPAQAERVRDHARIHLDWRWRFEVIAGTLGLAAPVLGGELLDLGGDSKVDHAR